MRADDHSGGDSECYLAHRGGRRLLCFHTGKRDEVVSGVQRAVKSKTEERKGKAVDERYHPRLLRVLHKIKIEFL